MLKILALLLFSAVPAVEILLTCGKDLNDRNISIRREVWANNTNLTPPLIIDEPEKDVKEKFEDTKGLIRSRKS
jgi:hypothetical protein